jgi:hypothetical protein
MTAPGAPVFEQRHRREPPTTIRSRSRRQLQEHRARGTAPTTGAITSVHEVRLVDHPSRLATTDADEHAGVEPRKLGAGGLDLSGSPERVLVGIDFVTRPRRVSTSGLPVRTERDWTYRRSPLVV